MSFLSRWILLNVFTALLPPIDPDEEDYYSRLGLDRRKNVTQDEIRKAFRKQSLKYHPDKIAQRGGGSSADGLSPTEAAAKFRDIQEAYQVLSDAEKRQEYHYWNCSVVRYQFLHNAHNHTPMTIYSNLAKARFRDKARLVAVAGTILIIMLLPFLLIASAVNQTLEDDGGLSDASWGALFIPVWAVFAMSFGLVFLAIAVTKSVSLGQIVGLIERASWLSALVILVQQWDGKRDVTDWHWASTPFYFAAAFRVIGRIIWIASVQEEINKMVSPEHLQKAEAEMLEGTSLEDLTEEELETLHARYHVVTPDPVQVVVALEILKSQNIDLRVEGKEEELEGVRVQCSPEYRLAKEQMREARNTALYIVLFGIPLIPLTAAKLNGDIDASWWTVIMPLWVYWTVRMIRACALCLGMTGPDLVVVGAGEESEAMGTENAVSPPIPPKEKVDKSALLRSASPMEVPPPPAAVVSPSIAATSPKEGENADNSKTLTKETTTPFTAPVPALVDEEVRVLQDTQKEDEGNFVPDDEKDMGLSSFVSGDEEVMSDTPSDEGTWRELTQTRDPPGVGPDDQELLRLEIERRKQVSEASHKTTTESDTPSTAAEVQDIKAAQDPPSSTSEPLESKLALAPSPASTDAPVQPKANNDNSGRDDPDLENQDDPELDEDMFRNWQRMQEEEDSSAMEAQAKGQGLCCATIFQMIMACLIVGKLEQDYPRPVDGSVGYSAYWIIFPILLLGGIILCCCTMLICSNADPDALHESGENNAADEEAQKQNDGSQNSGGSPTTGGVVPSAPAEPEAEIPAAAPATPVSQPVPTEDLNELD